MSEESGLYPRETAEERAQIGIYFLLRHNNGKESPKIRQLSIDLAERVPAEKLADLLSLLLCGICPLRLDPIDDQDPDLAEKLAEILRREPREEPKGESDQ